MRSLLHSFLLLAGLLQAATAQAGPTLSMLDLGVGVRFTGIEQQGAQIASSSALMGLAGPSTTAFAGDFPAHSRGLVGVQAGGGLAFMATDTIFTPRTVQGGVAPSATGFAARGGLVDTGSFVVGITDQGGLRFFEPGLGLNFVDNATPGLFSTGSELLNVSLQQGQTLFGQADPLGAGVLRGVMGVTEDGRLRAVGTDRIPSTGFATSRPLGFAQDTGLAEVAGFIVGINQQGSLNAYVSALDLLFENIGPAGLFSTRGGLEAFENYGIDGGGLFDAFGELGDSRGVIGITPDGNLAYVRLDVILADAGDNAFALLRSDLNLGLDPDSGLLIRDGVLFGMAADPAQDIPEPGSAALMLAALGMLALTARRPGEPEGRVSA